VLFGTTLTPTAADETEAHNEKAHRNQKENSK
jgi:hypothetical protein